MANDVILNVPKGWHIVFKETREPAYKSWQPCDTKADAERKLEASGLDPEKFEVVEVTGK